MGKSEGRERARICQRCGKQYQAGGYKFCSRECMLGTGVCKKCGKAFQCEYVGQKKCRACQGHAQERACPVCGKVVAMEQGRTFCSKACYEQARARVPDHCPVCGVDVPKGRKYCSDACRDKAHGMVQACPVCGKEFKGRIHHKQRQKYCSRECAAQAQKRVKKAVCQQCGKEFEVGRGCKGTFCSKVCLWDSLRKAPQAREVVCPTCGGMFTTSTHWKKYCCQACAKREFPRMGYADQYDAMVEWLDALSKRIAKRTDSTRPCITCGRMFYNPNPQVKNCSKACIKRYENLRSDKRIYRNGRPDLSISLPKVYARAGGVCIKCGAKLTFDCDPNSKKYPSIDHIVPLAKGGLHRWGNVQLLCRGCNSAKCDEVPAKECAGPQTMLDGWGLQVGADRGGEGVG